MFMVFRMLIESDIETAALRNLLQRWGDIDQEALDQARQFVRLQYETVLAKLRKHERRPIPLQISDILETLERTQ